MDVCNQCRENLEQFIRRDWKMLETKKVTSQGRPYRNSIGEDGQSPRGEMPPGVLVLLSGWSKWKLVLRALLWPHSGEEPPARVWNGDSGPRSYATSPPHSCFSMEALREESQERGRGEQLGKGAREARPIVQAAVAETRSWICPRHLCA